MGRRGQALIAVPLIVAVLTGAFAVLAHFLISAFDIPVHLHMPTVMRAAGVGLLAFGFFFMGWLFLCSGTDAERWLFLRAGPQG